MSFIYIRGTSSWIKNNLNIPREALKPLLNYDSQSHYKDAIIPLELAQGFDSLNSPIGLIYLFQSLLNGYSFVQDFNGNWTKRTDEKWPSSFKKIYLDYHTSEYKDTKFNNFINSITPYFQLIDSFGIDFYKHGYASSNKKTVFPFAEKYLHTLRNFNNNNRTLSAYFNATSMLISLGFTPYYSTYIIDPNTTNDKVLKNGVGIPSYIENMYPKIISQSKKPSDGTIKLIKQTTTGIWEHHVNPIDINLAMLRVGTIFVDDWMMPEIFSLYNDGKPIVNHIIYNTQGDYTLNGEIFFTNKNKLAQFNSTQENKTENVSGFFPKNLLEIPDFYQTYLGNQDYSSTGIPGQLGNSIFDIYPGFQWFANQIYLIKNNEFQIPKTSNSFQREIKTNNPFNFGFNPIIHTKGKKYEN